jgi:hypothetical protein
MPLDPDQLAIVRDEIGTVEPPSDGDLDDIYDRKGGLVGVVRTVWAQRLANLLAEPATFSVAGEYSQSTRDNIEGIQNRLKELSGTADDSDDIPPGGLEAVQEIHSYQLVRPDCSR